ncbi:MAG: PHP domain-containing protein [Nigerium sp.]|nr:PHP domain-containing protein [Nigerium sp.]
MDDEVLGPIASLREAARLLERRGGQARRAQAFRRAAEVLTSLDAGERAEVDARGGWRDLPGIGTTTARVIAEAHAGRVPAYLADLRASDGPLVAGANPLLAEIRGDLHTHTAWSDGSSMLEEMALEAVRLGREWLAITDHSARLRVANGLDTTRRLAQLARIRELDAGLPGFTLFAGAEVDILNDGSLDGEPAALDPLDVVVASVHSTLALDADAMTARMVTAIANPRTNVLGHCTGRLVAGDRGTRPPSRFDAEVVFEACRQFGVAVEINSRPERRDPPDDLLALAAEMGCLVAIDTDAHAPGQLGFSEYGAARAASVGLTAARIVTCWSADEVRGWAGRGR